MNNGTYLLMILQMKKKVRLQIFMATLLEYRNLIYKSQFIEIVKFIIELNRCVMACEGCGAVFSLTYKRQ